MREAAVDDETRQRMVMEDLQKLRPIANDLGKAATDILGSCARSLMPIVSKYWKLRDDERQVVSRSVSIVTGANMLWKEGLKGVYNIDIKLSELHLALVKFGRDLDEYEKRRPFMSRPKLDLNLVVAIEEPMFTLMGGEAFKQSIHKTLPPAEVKELYEHYRNPRPEQPENAVPPAYLDLVQKQQRLEELAQENEAHDERRARENAEEERRDQERRDKELAEQVAREEVERMAQENLKEQLEKKQQAELRKKEAHQEEEERQERRKKADEERAKRARQLREEEMKGRDLQIAAMKRELAEVKKCNQELKRERREESRRQAEPAPAPHRTNVHVSTSVKVGAARPTRRSVPERKRSHSFDDIYSEEEYPEPLDRNPFRSPGPRTHQAVRTQYLGDCLRVTDRAMQHLDLDYYGHRGYSNSHASSVVVTGSFNNNSVQIGCGGSHRQLARRAYDKYYL